MGPSQGATALSKDVLLVFVPSEPVQDWISKIKSRYPGIEIRWENLLNGDGTFRAPADIAEETWAGVTMACSFIKPPPAKLLASVRFLQLASAGVEHWRGHPTYEDRNVVICTANGTHA